MAISGAYLAVGGILGGRVAWNGGILILDRHRLVVGHSSHSLGGTCYFGVTNVSRSTHLVISIHTIRRNYIITA